MKKDTNKKKQFKKAMIHGDPRDMLDTLAKSKAPKKLFKGKGRKLERIFWGA